MVYDLGAVSKELIVWLLAHRGVYATGLGKEIVGRGDGIFYYKTGLWDSAVANLKL